VTPAVIQALAQHAVQGIICIITFATIPVQQRLLFRVQFVQIVQVIAMFAAPQASAQRVAQGINYTKANVTTLVQ